MSEIFRETLHKGLIQEIKIKRKLVDKSSKYQKIQIFDSLTYGRVLALDGIVQITEKDEAAYSEMLVHPLIYYLRNPKRVLIIGGGDGAVAEELLKYKFIQKIDLVDIDIEVINLSKKYLKRINKNSLIDKRVNIFVQDALVFTENTNKKYDIVIADRPDPVGAGKNLFKIKFYKNIKNILSSKGIAIFQSGVPFLQKNETRGVCKHISSTFKNSGVILTVVPSYIGGYMALVWGSNKSFLNINRKKKHKIQIKTEYFNEELSYSSLTLPNFIKKLT